MLIDVREKERPPIFYYHVSFTAFLTPESKCICSRMIPVPTSVNPPIRWPVLVTTDCVTCCTYNHCEPSSRCPGLIYWPFYLLGIFHYLTERKGTDIVTSHIHFAVKTRLKGTFENACEWAVKSRSSNDLFLKKCLPRSKFKKLLYHSKKKNVGLTVCCSLSLNTYAARVQLGYFMMQNNEPVQIATRQRVQLYFFASDSK